MTVSAQPLVTVTTPVYNGAKYLARSIESVLAQTYECYEYVIVNNCSTDGTLDIALSYAKKDSRIRVHDNDRFLEVIENHNHAFRLISPASKYCKVVSADDFIFPECLARMVELAEASPSVGLVGSYMIAGKQVLGAGLEYERRIVPGSEICRATLLGGPYVFGSPTSLLYKADLLRKTEAFYPNSNPHADTSACYKWLEHCDFGFVHQVLSYAQIHAESQTSRSITYGIVHRARIGDLVEMRSQILTGDEHHKVLTATMDWYYGWLVRALFERRRDDEFWKIQREGLKEIGFELSMWKLAKAFVMKGLSLLTTPGAALRKMAAMKKHSGQIEAHYYE